MSHKLNRILVLLCTLYAIPASAQNVFISEYIEGSSNNKAIEIYNGTGAPLDLGAGGYNVQMFFNGGTTVGTSINLTGVVAPGDVFVLAQSSANATILAQADQTNGSAWYNGDDAVVLRKGTTVLDVIGQVGFDPGTEWGTGVTSTADNTIRRKSTVCAGDTNGADAFDPATEWNGFATDDATNLGSHTASCGGSTAPTVNSTVPAQNAINVAATSSVTITFSRQVAATAGAFTFNCNGAVTFTSTASPATSYVLSHAAPMPDSTSCSVGVDKSAISAVDNGQHPDNDYTLTFTTAAPAQPLTASSPQAGAASLDPAANIVINFSRSVTAPSTAFSVSCAASIGVSGSPGTAITIDPNGSLPFNTDCTVTADASQIFAAQAPTQMASNFVFTFHTASKPVATNVMINEVDADTPGDDRAEFVELYGPPNTDLDGLVVVFYNGVPPSNSQNNPNPFEHQSYASFDLDGKKTDANGYFVLGNPAVATDGPNGLTFDPGQFGLLQNGPDAVALYVGNASDFPNGTPGSGALPTTGLVDAVVYDTDDADDSFLKALNGNQPQINENISGDSQHQSIARCANGTGGVLNTSTYLATTPTPGAANVCPTSRPPSDIVISQIYGGGGNSNATFSNDFVELHNLSTTNSVDTLGWTLQYTSAGGVGTWFNKQPLGGIIGPGEYYLIKLGSNDTSVGAALPVTPNIIGSLNLGATAGKLALVSNGESIAGECPIFNPNVKDFVGYGTTATCSEGATRAPAPSNTTADFRKNFGNTDIDVNGSDFATGTPNPRRTTPIQELPPFLFATDPQSGGTNVPRDPTIVLTFTEAVDVDPGFYNVSCDSGIHNSASVAGTGSFKDITLNDTLTPGEHCTVTIDHTKVHDSDTDDPPFYDLLPEDVSWTFTVASGAPPPYTADIHLTFGNPSGAIADLNVPNNYLMLKPEYSLSYDRDLGRPNWVSWHLSNDWTGTLPRVDTFRADPAIPPPSDPPSANDWYRVESFDFAGSGFDRGHMTPNADRDQEGAAPINQATFLMTNMVAQSPDNNQGPWAEFEGYLRTLMPEDPAASSEAYVIAGPYGVGGTGSNGYAETIAGGHVTVPSATWKVVLLLPKGSNDLSRVDCSTRTIAVIMPNVQDIRTDHWEKYLTTVDAVEGLTGYDFFSNLSPQVQQCIEAGTNGVNPPLDMTPPSFNCQAADGAWHGNNVTLSCTATDDGSGLANISDASFTLMTSVVSGTETSNALTDTRTVCDKAGNCATAGPIGNNMIDRNAPVVTCATADGAWHNSDVTIACSTTDGGAGVSAADASFGLSTSVAPGTVDANASTGTRAVCDGAGNCVTAGPVAGNKIDRIAPSITLSSPANGAIYQLNRAVTAAFACTDSESGLATCAGTAANGAAIDTASTGTKTFTVNATDVAGNTSSFGVTYTVLSNAISISNVPTGLMLREDSFVPTFDYAGDGATSVTSLTLKQCTVENGAVVFQKKGTCTIVAHATATATFDAADGPQQSFEIDPHKLKNK
jgi:DNA/RNA endonuclease G (NUC1)